MKKRRKQAKRKPVQKKSAGKEIPYSEQCKREVYPWRSSPPYTFGLEYQYTNPLEMPTHVEPGFIWQWQTRGWSLIPVSSLTNAELTALLSETEERLTDTNKKRAAMSPLTRRIALSLWERIKRMLLRKARSPETNGL